MTYMKLINDVIKGETDSIQLDGMIPKEICDYIKTRTTLEEIDYEPNGYDFWFTFETPDRLKRFSFHGNWYDREYYFSKVEYNKEEEDKYENYIDEDITPEPFDGTLGD